MQSEGASSDLPAGEGPSAHHTGSEVGDPDGGATACGNTSCKGVLCVKNHRAGPDRGDPTWTTDHHVGVEDQRRTGRGSESVVCPQNDRENPRPLASAVPPVKETVLVVFASVTPVLIVSATGVMSDGGDSKVGAEIEGIW